MTDLSAPRRTLAEIATLSRDELVQIRRWLLVLENKNHHDERDQRRMRNYRDRIRTLQERIETAEGK